MSLATRCPNCNTVFQVNEEQLKRYSGVVRCGVCNNPFNGIDHLIGRLSQTDAPPSNTKAEKASPVIAASEERQGKPAAHQQLLANNNISSNLPYFSTKITTDKENSTESDTTEAREAALKAAFEKQMQSINFDLNLPSLNEERTASSAIQSDMSTAVDIDAKAPENVGALTAAERKEPFLSPESVKDNTLPSIIVNAPEQANRKPATDEELVNILQKKKKRSRFSQFIWSLGSLVLLLLLGAQGIYRYSEDIVAWWPPAEELVNTTCELLTCPVEVPVKKPPLSVDAKAPKKLENVPDQYVQNITIINNSTDQQIWPSLVIELTDSDNKVLLRRIFQPAEYLPEEAGTVKGLQAVSDISFNIAFEFAHHSAVNSRVSLLNNP